MEFSYLAMNSVVIGNGKYDWEPLENLLADVASRACQTVFRFYLEYPSKPIAIPKYLLDGGLKVHEYINTNTQPLPPAKVITPDYQDINLRSAMKSFIVAMGNRYDGDPRIGFITAGLLGTWGEWHTHPRMDLWASKEVQIEIMDAYENAFQKTAVLLRYPAAENDGYYAPTFQRGMGYHDDSFGWATLATGKKGDDWFFLARMATGGETGLNAWKRLPIGGEIRPELWGCLWTEKGCAPQGQDFMRCVEETHATWLMDTSTSRKLADDQKQRAMEAARRLGYELYVPWVEMENAPMGETTIRVAMTNRGVAPFYYPWKVQLGWIDAKGYIVNTVDTDWIINGILPGQHRIYSTKLPAGAKGNTLALRVPNPMPGGIPLRFANATQDKDAPGWLSLTGD